MAHKICPKCQTPAPLEADFCGQCGRQYRTKFVAGVQQAPLQSVSPSVLPLQVNQEQTQRHPGHTGSKALSVAIVVMASVVALLILTVVNRSKYSEEAGRTVRSVQPSRVAAPSAESPSPSEMVQTGVDPIEDAAKREVDRANIRLQTSPPPSAIGPDGRVHLRGGGSITREQWEDANRRAHSSRAFSDPMPPPPVN